MLPDLPLEVLCGILAHLPDITDLLSLRLTCKKTLAAVSMTRHPLQWFPGAEHVGFPWRCEKMLLNKYVPSETFPEVLHSYPVVYLTLCDQIIGHRWEPPSSSKLTSLTIENVYGLIDLCNWTSLQTLIVNGDNRREEVSGVRFPPSLRHLRCRYLTTHVDLRPCTQLQTVIVENCSMYYLQTLADAERVELGSIWNEIDIAPLSNVPELFLNNVDTVAPPVLSSRLLQISHLNWRRLPELPNIVSLRVVDKHLPEIRQEDILRCRDLYMFSTDDILSAPLSPLMPIASNIRQLNLLFCYQTGALPVMPELEELRLEFCPRIRPPPSAPHLKQLFLREVPVVAASYPQLEKFSVHVKNSDYLNRALRVVPQDRLRELKLFFWFNKRCRFVVPNLPHLRVLHCINERRELDATNILTIENRGWGALRDCILINICVPDVTFMAGAHTVCLKQCDILVPEQLRTLERVPVLTLESCNVQDAGLFANAHTLDLSDTGVVDVSGLARVRNLTVANTSILSVNGLRSIHTLNIDCTAVVDLSPLAEHPCLVYLSMCATAVGNVTPLGTIPTLRRVSAVDCTQIVDANPLHSVQTLDFNGCVSLRFVRELRTARFLDLRGCVEVDPADVFYLQSYVTNLEWDLNIQYENDGDIM